MSHGGGPQHLPQTLRRLRTRRGLSIERLAVMARVSRSAISDIERGKKAPTVNLIGRIARALDVELPALVEGHATVSVLRGSAPDASGCRALTPPAGPSMRARLFEVRVVPRTRSTRAAYPAGTVANLLVSAGSLAVELGDERHQLGSGDAIRFEADRPHALVNDGAALAVAYLVTSGATVKGVSSIADERPLTDRPL